MCTEVKQGGRRVGYPEARGQRSGRNRQPALSVEVLVAGPVVAGRDPAARLQRAAVPTLLHRPSEEPVGAAGSLWRRGGAGPSGRPADDQAQTKARAPVGDARADNLGRPVTVAGDPRRQRGRQPGVPLRGSQAGRSV
ncbi:TIMELESS-interacting protein [Sarotherodon galilaeus]